MRVRAQAALTASPSPASRAGAFEELSFPAPDRGGETVVVDKAMVLGSLGSLAEVTDVSRYVL